LRADGKRKAVCMEEDLRRAKQYATSKIRLMVLQLLLTAVFLILILFSGTSSLLKGLVASWSGNFYLQVGLYLAIFGGIYYLLFIWLDFYGDFLLEHKFGLSNQTVTDWLKKSIKKALLSLLLVLVAVEGLYLFLRHFPNHWWLLATAAWVLFAIVLGKIAPVLIIPLFYKCSPLANEELKGRLLVLCKNCGVGIERVFEIQLSKETQKANAAVAGLGKGRRILLSDTLLENYCDDEIEAIFAHELGHIRLLHTWKILGVGTVISLAGFYLTFLLFKASVSLLGFAEIYDISAFPALSLILMIVGLVFMPVQNGYLRYLEKQADMFAGGHIQSKQSFISAIGKLGEQNLSDPSPGKLVEFLLYDHPSISKRVHYLSGENTKRSEL